MLDDIKHESIYDGYMEERRRIVQDDHLFAIQWGLIGRLWRPGSRRERRAAQRSQHLQFPTPRPSLTKRRRRQQEGACLDFGVKMDVL